MADRSDPSALRWLIGNELRLARLDAGRTQSAAAKALGCTHSKINYLEIGRNQQHPEEVTTLLRFYGAGEAQIDRLASLSGRADQGTWWAAFSDVVPDWMKTFVGLEGLASREFMYEPLALPGLVQTPEYAQALLADNLRVSAVDAERVVKLRMERQQRLFDVRSPLSFRTVIEESVLDRLVGGTEVMASQLRHLLELARQDNVTMHVMPLSVPVHDGLDGEFSVLDFEEAKSVGYIEYPNGAIYIQDENQVAAYGKAANRLCSTALTEEESIEEIAKRAQALS
ncbi:helix-turn-helix domain-containing protein [Actinopolyspora xinjiangensis]|uniref:helix-turn-helix domain-containing protein n=1 Tax=Actinopolyspora xinjiangensis TaxID=405564 RepID=UPI000B89C239|nr:helix-turn-helix transcriptional regulator [Actinopolyspora xinjiangensis]